MHVLLIYPEIPDTFWSFKYALKFIHKKAGTPPLGLLTVAAMLPPEWSLRLVDLNVEPLTRADLEKADLAFISGMSVQRDSAAEVIARCRDAGVRTVAGGPLFTMEHEHFPGVDHFVLNEAELTLQPFLADLAAGQARRIYQADPDAYADIHQTPQPVWRLADLRHYSTVSIQFSRGCPFNCDFCNVTSLLGHEPRTKSTAQVISELDAVYALGWRGGIFFVDDNFICNRRQLKAELLPALIEWRRGKSGLPFSTEVSINLADDPELVRLMSEAGFDTIFVGIETPSDAALDECGKFQNRGRDLAQSIRVLQMAGLQVQGGFIVGFDSDTSTIFRQQAEFIQRTGIVSAMVGLLQAPPGTRLFERMQKEGRLVSGFNGDNVDGSTNIVPRMGLERLRQGYFRLLDELYAPKQYYARVKTFLSQYRVPPIRYHIEWQYFLALFRSIYQLGIRGIERAHYWRLFFWTLFRRPELFPLAITLAIYGYHFRTVAANHVG